MDKSFKIFVIIAILVLTVGIGAVTFLLLTQKNGETTGTDSVVEEQIKPVNIVEVSMGDPIMTNIALGEDKIQHFAKMQISLGINQDNEKKYKELELLLASKSASIRNELIDTIGSQTYNMLTSTDGKTKLADEIVIRLNKLLDTDLVCEVYYGDYFVQ